MLEFLKRWQLSNRLAVVKMERELAGIQANYPLSSGYRGSELYEMLTTGTASYAGPAVNERTAMSVGAVYACVRLIAGAIASLPLPVYERTADGRKRVDHEFWWLLNEQPNATMSAAVFWEYLIQSILLSGDAFAIIRHPRESDPRITGFEPVHPARIQVQRSEGRLKYTVFDDNGSTKGFDQDDILHVPGIGFDGLRSMSPIRHAGKQAVGLALAAEEHSARVFSNGARPDIAIEVPGALKEEQIELLRNTWDDRFGGASKSHRPAVLTGGVKVHEISMNAEDAALIATRQFQVIDIARLYGVPPFMIAETEKTTSWGSGVEHMGIGFVKYTLRPHLARIEQELRRKLFREKNEKYFAEFNVDGLMEGDSKAQAEYFGKALGGPGAQGWMTVNEVRRLKNMPPLDDYNTIPRAGAANDGETHAPNSQTGN